MDLPQLLQQLIQIGIALTSERNLSVLLERILTEARRFTRAEAGTLYLWEGNRLRFAVVQNDRLARQLGEGEMRNQLKAVPLALDKASLAGWVVCSGESVNIPDAYEIPPERPYILNREVDARTGYRTRSVLVVPLKDSEGNVLGVLELINALDARNNVVPFDPNYEELVCSLASQAAVALRNAQLEDLAFKDSLTGLFNRRYLMLRLEEESKRHERSKQPVSLVLIDVDHFKAINDRFGHGAGDEALKEVSRLLVKHSRGFTVIARHGGDEFAVLLVDASKAGAVTYAQRIKTAIERHAFGHGPLTVSLGVACLPQDVPSAADLISAADKALYDAKRLGRNRVGMFSRVET